MRTNCAPQSITLFLLIHIRPSVLHNPHILFVKNSFRTKRGDRAEGHLVRSHHPNGKRFCTPTDTATYLLINHHDARPNLLQYVFRNVSEWNRGSLKGGGITFIYKSDGSGTDWYMWLSAMGAYDVEENIEFSVTLRVASMVTASIGIRICRFQLFSI